jgi:urea transport system ATP-binding protein
VLFKGQDLTRLAEHQIVRLGVGRKFQTPSVYEDLSVAENFEISIPDARHRRSLFFRRDAAVQARIHAAAEQVFLNELLNQGRAG